MPWNKGKRLSEDTRQKMSEAHSGENHHMYGKHHSAETKKKISEAKLDKKNPMYGKKGEEAPNFGKHLSEETRKKLSEALSGKNNPMYRRHHSAETRRKISKIVKGRMSSEETQRKLSLANSGENNPRWLGGKSFEPYGVEFNDELKEQIRERDNYQCQLCGLYEKELSSHLSVHHIDYCKTNNDPQNLISLSDSCHGKTSFNRDKWKTYFKGAMIPLSNPILFLRLPSQAPLREFPLPL